MNGFIVCEELSGLRADKAIADTVPELSRSFVQRLLENGDITINGKPAQKSSKLCEGDSVLIAEIRPQPLQCEAQNIPLDIRYEDDDLLVVNKSRGMVVHPAPGNPDGTLVNALLYHCGDSLSGINGFIRPGIVHRIDKDTSGLLIVAKNDRSHLSLAQQIKEHSFKREYRAVVHGHLRQDCGTVDAPIGRSEKDRKKMCVTDKNSREAVTHYTVLEQYDAFSLVALRLETGRTHQIRVHMAHIGHPVAGDPVYGPKNGVVSLGGQCLHAGLIGFIHPCDGRYVEITSPLPNYFENFIKSIK